MRFAAALLLPLLCACATDAGHSTASMTDGSIVHTIRCDDNWDACYRTANRICGASGFEEVDRSATSSLSTAGRLERMHTVEGPIDKHRYSENTRLETGDRVLAVHCNAAQRPD